MSRHHDPTDPHDLRRFARAQELDYARALAELRSGGKRTHWMWHVFPQLLGLGRSAKAIEFSIRSVAECRAYLQHPVLGPRLLECAEACLKIEGRSAREIFGPTDETKLKSSATLFASVAPPGSVFDRVLDRYFLGERDTRTLELLEITDENT
jgi:uncharacterized protein (DUF1810 family)